MSPEDISGLPSEPSSLVCPAIKEAATVINEQPPAFLAEAKGRHGKIESGKSFCPILGYCGAVFNEGGAL